MKPNQKKTSRLRIERLEDRATPAVWNNPWPDPGNLTVSFAPEGAAMGSATNSLANLQAATPNWQGEVLRAFQTWMVPVNAGVSVTADSGRPFGEPGPIQGSPNYGDIRVGARPLTGSELAMATPFDFIAAGAGDIVFNSQAAFGVGGTDGKADLYTVALQEVGHALGLGNSTDPNSVMFTQYRGAKTGLHASDVAAIQKLYGVRGADRHESSDGNDRLDNTAELSWVGSGQDLGRDPFAGDKPFLATGDLSKAGDVDVYMVKSAKTTAGFFVELRTSGVSLLNAKVSVYNKDKVLVKSATATDPRSGDLSVSVANVWADAEYYVKVEGAGGRFNTGQYRLAVGQDARRAVFPAEGSQFVQDGRTNDTADKAKDLAFVSVDRYDSSGVWHGLTQLKAPDGRWDYLQRATVEAAGDRDFYKVKAPNDFSGVLAAVVSATEAGGLDPVISAYDDKGNRLAVDVLSNDRSSYSVQVRGVTSGKTYLLEVASAGTGGTAATGRYVLSADFRTTAVEFQTLGSGTLTQTQTQQAHKLELTHARTYHMSMTAGNTAAAAAVRTTIYDSAGRVVASFVARDGETVATDVFLGAGTYTIKVSGAGENGQPLPTLAYTLKGFIRNDPIGPGAADPTFGPAYGPSAPNPTMPALKPFSTVGWVYWVDDFSDPWSGV